MPADQIDPLLFDKSYYLEPEAKAAKPYALLREALVQTDRMAVVKVALRQRETLALLRVRDKAIVLQTMLWPDEVREPEFDILDADVELRPQELTMAASLVESLGADFDPSQFHDEYRDAVVELIERKRPPARAGRRRWRRSRPTSGDSMTDLLTRPAAQRRGGPGRRPASAAGRPRSRRRRSRRPGSRRPRSRPPASRRRSPPPQAPPQTRLTAPAKRRARSTLAKAASLVAGRGVRGRGRCPGALGRWPAPSNSAVARFLSQFTTDARRPSRARPARWS